MSQSACQINGDNLQDGLPKKVSRNLAQIREGRQRSDKFPTARAASGPIPKEGTLL